MGVDPGVRRTLAKVSNIVWFRLVPARSIATQTGRSGESEDATADEFVIAVYAPVVPE